ncbi:ABC transporter substrate-binding protein [Alsobacter sp. SYSU M60028]|uniref:ABC transporter substrate-binding protein n=1 Tax=Alsobacter ponti TaxID=2962936 RepID=A0ABT1LBA6_9HYPH|nr:ABC transporter substrate-binding protein [Alsobacter ponti]
MIIDRRTLMMSTAGLVLAAGARPASAQGAVAVRVGFVPVIGASALYVMQASGMAEKDGLKLALTKFDSGPNAIQALASGTLDIMVIGVSPIAVAKSKGIDVSVAASGAYGGSAFAAGPALDKAFKEAGGDPAKAFAAFRAANGRPAKLGTLPPGGVPTVALHHWLWKVGKVDKADVQIVAMGIEAVQQAMLTGAVDGGTLLEPSVTIVTDRDPRIKRIAVATEMFPQIPGVVIAVSGAFLKAQPDAAERFVAQAIRATELIKSAPDKAAPYVNAVLGGGLVSESLMAAALKSPAVKFETDPRVTAAATAELLAYQVELGDFPAAPKTEGLFDMALYERAAKRAAAN